MVIIRLDGGVASDRHAEIPALGLGLFQQPLAKIAAGGGTEADEAQTGSFAFHPNDLSAGVDGGGAIEAKAKVGDGALLEDGWASQSDSSDTDIVDFTRHTGSGLEL